MRVELRIISGSRAGQREIFEKSVIAIGRHPMNDLRFDPDKDPDASSKHAEIRIVDDKATVFDLQSTNGTFVNGQRVAGERVLADGDTIAFGDAGPKAEFRRTTESASPAATRMGAASPASGTPVVSVTPKSTTAEGSRPLARPLARRDTTARVAEAVEKQTAGLRNMIGALAGLVIVGVGVAYWAGNRGSAESRQQVEKLLHQNDSLGRMIDATVSRIQGKSAGVDTALQAARRESEELRRRLQAAASGGNAAEVALLSSDLAASANRRRALVSAAQVDWEAVAAQNSLAIAFLAVDLGDKDAGGEGLVSGTGFNVSPSGLIVTNRHVVQDSKGNPAKRIALKFDKAEGGFLKVSVVKVSQTDELAWLKVETPGKYPALSCIARAPAVRVGAPVALIGYPLGTSTAGMGGDINKLKPQSTLTVGTASKVLGDTLQLDVYAAQGSSGSPVFDARGCVIAVLFGSPTESNGRIIYAVPSSKLALQMPPEGAAIVK